MRVMPVRLLLAAILLATATAWLGHITQSAVAASLNTPCAKSGDGNEVLLCDDFEGGSTHARWESHRLPAVWPAAFVFCGDRFGYSDQCAARSAARATFTPSSELYVRWYQYVPKTTSSELPDTSVALSDPSDRLMISAGVLQNQEEGVALGTGRWFLVEWHVKLNSPGKPDGVTELWIDDTTRPIGAQTLRVRHTDLQWLGRGDAGTLLGTFRLTPRDCADPTQSCPVSEPERPYDSRRWDHIAVGRSPIGPGISPQGPAPPKGFRIAT